MIRAPTPSAKRNGGYVRLAIGMGLLMSGQNERAREELTLALALAQETDNYGVEASTRCSLGYLILAEGGNAHEALRYFQEGLRLYEKIGDNFIGFGLPGPGLVACRLKEYDLAHLYFVQSLEFCLEFRDSMFLMMTLPGVALYLALSNEIARAVEIWELARRQPFVGNSSWYENVIDKEIDALTLEMQPDVIAAAVNHGGALDTWETAEALRRELASQ